MEDEAQLLPAAPVEASAFGGAGAVQVVLAEKRTSLAVLRTGIAVAVVPLSVTTVLVTLSRFYSWLDNLHFLVPMYALLSALVLLSAYLIVRALRRIHHYDELLGRMRAKHPELRELLD